MKEEIFVDIIGYDGKYQVSNLGRVKTWSYHSVYNGKKDEKKCSFIKPHDNGFGYYQIRLSKNGKTKSFRLNRLVAEHFLPNPNNYKEVNHISRDRKDNSVWNLQWCNPSQNVRHSMLNGLQGGLTLSFYKASCIKSIYPLYKDKKYISKMFNCSLGAVYSVLSNKTWNENEYKGIARYC